MVTSSNSGTSFAISGRRSATRLVTRHEKGIRHRSSATPSSSASITAASILLTKGGTKNWCASGSRRTTSGGPAIFLRASATASGGMHSAQLVTTRRLPVDSFGRLRRKSRRAAVFRVELPRSEARMAKKTKPVRMSDKELARKLFPKHVRKLLKQALLDDGTKRKKR